MIRKLKIYFCQGVADKGWGETDTVGTLKKEEVATGIEKKESSEK